MDNLKYLGVCFRPAGVDAALDWQKKKVKSQRAATLLRGIGYHKGGLPVSTRILFKNTFAIPRVTYGLPTYPKLGVRRKELKKMDIWKDDPG